MNTINRTEGTIAIIILVLVIIGAVAYASYGTPAPAIAPSNPNGAAASSTSAGAPLPSGGTQPTQGTTSPAWETGMQVITPADNGTTVSLDYAKRERFVIQLGSTLDWTLAFSPADIITRVPNSTTADGIQGVYEADMPGTVTLRGTGAPICVAGQACPQFRQAVTVAFVIK